MNGLRQQILYGAVLFLPALWASCVPTVAQEIRLEDRASIGAGWHAWYEIKADRESPKNLVICGTKWDAARNAPFGFVYASADGGTTWNVVLEDRNTAWVTEQSCAFGQNHRAYFISEASKVTDGRPNHKLGATRLYVSTDGGEHWTETIKTGWADWSTSAVSSGSGRLYTFFNAATEEPGRNWGSNVGLLVFSPDGKNVTGPFFYPPIRELNYHGIYPSDATPLRSGAVVALYYGTRQGTTGREADLGVLRADQSSEPSLEPTVIFHASAGRDCLNLDDYSLAYDHERDRLFVVFAQGCKTKRLMVASSEDEGKTWESASIADAQNPGRGAAHPSLVVGSDGVLGLLWEEGQRSGRWLFSYIRDQKLIQPTTELSRGQEKYELSSDSLWTWVYQPNRPQAGEPNVLSEPSITLNVRTELNNIWRANGLVITGDKILAVWPSGDGDGMRLYSGIFTPVGSISKRDNFIDPKDSIESDVTGQTVILYGGTQHFDSGTSTLKVCLALGNRGDKPIGVPIKLEVKDIKSPVGGVSILNATNGLAGAGAIWDISGSVTGDRIPPGTTSNPFCVSLRIGSFPEHVPSHGEDDLLLLRIRVLASSGYQ